MTVTTEPEFYDVAMVEDGAPAMLPLEVSGWQPLYREAAGWIPADRDVVDLGCGTGRFGHALHQAGHRGGYVGVDFSAATLAEARRYLTTAGLPHLDFIQADLRQWQPSRSRGNCVYTCLETLEHLADDQDLVYRIPPGHTLIFSVPNYDDTAHIRTFRSVRDLWTRYGDLLDFRRWSLIDMGGDRWKIHLCETSRRSDSW